MSDWRDTKRKADRFNPIIDLILRLHLGDMVEVIEADELEDQRHATDSMIHATHPRAARRVRSCASLPKPDMRDVTIRSWRPIAMTTEMDKLLAGYVSHYFYGWAASWDAVGLVAWVLFRVRPFTDSGLLHAARELPVHDGSAKFRPVAATDLFRVPGCVVASEGIDPPADVPRLFWPEAV